MATQGNCPYGTCDGGGFVWHEPSEAHPHGHYSECRCRPERRRAREARRMLTEAGLTDATLGRYTFDAFSVEAAACATGRDRATLARQVAAVRAYAEAPEGWLVLVGPVGCGKTHLAYAVVRECARRGRGVYYGSVPEVLDALRRGYSDEALDYEHRLRTMQEVELLVLDDLGTEHQTPWVSEKLFQVVNHRYTRRLPLLVTTNVVLTDGGCGVDPRIRSRLLDRGLSRLLALPAGDYRRAGT